MLHRIVPTKTFTKSTGANLPMRPRIVQIKPLRNRSEQTSTGQTESSRQNLSEIVGSKHPHATPHRQDKTFTNSSGANFLMLSRIVQIKPLGNRTEQTSTSYPASSRKTCTKSPGASLNSLPRIVKIKPSQHRPEPTSTCHPASSE